MIVTEVLQQQAGIEYGGVKDQSESDPRDSLANVLFTGQFKRGRFDKPMLITLENLRPVLGYDPENPEYTAIEDALADGAPFVWVQRIGQKNIDLDPWTNFACTTGTKTLSFNSAVKVDLSKNYGFFGELMTENLADKIKFANNIDLLDYATQVGEDHYLFSNNTLSEAIRQLSYVSDQEPDRNLSSAININYELYQSSNSWCSAYFFEGYFSLRSYSSSWTSASEVTYTAVTNNDDSRSVTMPAQPFSTAGEIYNYMMSLYEKFKPLIESMGFTVEIDDDQTFKNSSATFFNPGYFPSLYVKTDTERPIVFSSSSATLYLNGYLSNSADTCRIFKSEAEITVPNTAELDMYYPDSEWQLEYAPEYKAYFKFDTTTPQKDGVINILHALNVKGDFSGSICYLQPPR
jgi:hypothetical protein